MEAPPTPHASAAPFLVVVLLATPLAPALAAGELRLVGTSTVATGEWSISRLEVGPGDFDLRVDILFDDVSVPCPLRAGFEIYRGEYPNAVALGGQFAAYHGGRDGYTLTWQQDGLPPTDVSARTEGDCWYGGARVTYRGLPGGETYYILSSLAAARHATVTTPIYTTSPGAAVSARASGTGAHYFTIDDFEKRAYAAAYSPEVHNEDETLGLTWLPRGEEGAAVTLEATLTRTFSNHPLMFLNSGGRGRVSIVDPSGGEHRNEFSGVPAWGQYVNLHGEHGPGAYTARIQEAVGVEQTPYPDWVVIDFRYPEEG